MPCPYKHCIENRAVSVFQAKQTNLIQQGLVRNSELFGGACFVPLRCLKSGFNSESLDVFDCSRTNLLQSPTPIESIVDHALRHAVPQWLRGRELQIGRVNRIRVREN